MTAPVIVGPVNALWLSDAATMTPARIATMKQSTNRHLPAVVTAPPVLPRVPFAQDLLLNSRLRPPPSG